MVAATQRPPEIDAIKNEHPGRDASPVRVREAAGTPAGVLDFGSDMLPVVRRYGGDHRLMDVIPAGIKDKFPRVNKLL